MLHQYIALFVAILKLVVPREKARAGFTQFGFRNDAQRATAHVLGSLERIADLPGLVFFHFCVDLSLR